MGENIFATGLGRGDANSAALTPVSFLPRTAATHPDRTAIVHGARRVTYREYDARARRLASALAARGIGPGDTVAVVLPNVPAMLEVHQAVPAIGAVLNAVNTRLDARTIAYILGHGEARALIVDREFSPSVGAALAQLERKPLVIDHDDPLYDGPGPRLGGVEYEDLLAEGSPDFAPAPIRDEWQPIALNYTSGTTGNPKGVVAHHRGVWMMLVGEILAWHIPAGAVYLWTLPMFHANGWGFPWAITAVGGTHVCLRRVEPATIFRLLAEQRVTHMCGAPTVLNMLINAPAESRPPRDHVVDLMTGGAAPPAKILRAMSELGFRVQHIYGLTEVLGPSTLCAWQDGWATLTPEERAARQARQGVPYHVVEGQRVADPKTIEPVPADGTTLGEVMLRGWFHTGDLAVQHPDGYIEIRDRSKDIIISGGENISSLMVEAALTRHPAVALAAVVARPDEKWGETPCAFVELRPGTEVTAEALIAFARANLPHFAVPKTVIFGPLPATATGKIQKFELRQRARAL
ncbi:MAG: AMP-binding protein [Candidatus Rokubacteria bacterium]|nr:AMP-binding protein [Candidatus Rokubacteria bacterium]